MWRFICTLTLAVVIPGGQQLFAKEAQTAEALSIIKKSFSIKRSGDSLSRLTFIIKQDEQTSKLVFDQVWKEYKKGPYESKTMYFQNFPPDRKGIAYMGWFPRKGSQTGLEEWLYLPELRIVRRIGGNEISDEEKTKDTFDKSEMKEIDLIPRQPDVDEYQYLREATIKGIHYHVIASRPKHHTHHNGAHAQHMKENGGYPYSKTIRWIRQDNFLPERIDYYDKEGKLLKRQITQWQKIDDTWEWKSVVTKNLQNNNETRLDISKLRINVGLKDKVFSKRMMKLGFNRVR